MVTEIQIRLNMSCSPKSIIPKDVDIIKQGVQIDRTKHFQINSKL